MRCSVSGRGIRTSRRDAELAAVEFLNAGDVLRRLALHALMQVAPVVNPPDLAQFFVGVRIEPGAIVTRWRAPAALRR